MTAVASRAFGYLRVSTAEQAGSGLGVEAQRAAVEALAHRLAIRLDSVFSDLGISGGLPLEQRPGLLAALDALKKGDVLLVAKRDRLGRDVLNVAMFERLVERKGARVVSAAGEGTEANDPTSRLLRQIVDSFAEYERAVIRTRTRAALGVKKARGERVGGIPFGFRLSADRRSLEPAPAEHRAVMIALALRASGLSYAAIAAELNRQGFRSRTGSLWVRQSVHVLTSSRRFSETGRPEQPKVCVSL